MTLFFDSIDKQTYVWAGEKEVKFLVRFSYADGILSATGLDGTTISTSRSVTKAMVERILHLFGAREIADKFLEELKKDLTDMTLPW